MFRQLAGILLLFTFLFAKGNLLFADRVVDKITIVHESQQDAEEPADDEKESKNMEFADEFISHSLVSLSPVLFSKKLIHTDFANIEFVHFSVWGPPPNCALLSTHI